MSIGVGATSGRRHNKGNDGIALSVVIPCLDEEEILVETWSRVSKVCKQSVGDGYEVLLVNDGSVDGTWAIIAGLVERDSHVIGVNLARRHGHQLALSAGLSVCRGRRVLILDADLQDPPELLPEMLRLMEEGADVVYGQRKRRAGEQRLKLASASLFYRLLDRLVDIPIPPDTGDFRLMSRRALDVLNAMPERHRFVRGMVSWIGYRQVPIRYDRQPRGAGVSKYTYRKMLSLAMDAITSFSILPLRIASQLGMTIGCLAILLMAYVLSSWLSGNAVQGWTSVISVVLLIGSVQLIVLGIMGEYIGRTFIEVKQRPLFVIEQVATGQARGRNSGGIRGEGGTVPLT